MSASLASAACARALSLGSSLQLTAFSPGLGALLDFFADMCYNFDAIKFSRGKL